MVTSAAKLTAGMHASLDESTRLSLKRTQLSAQRTLMSWIRTSFSMISFGFTMGKFLEYLASQPGARPRLGEGQFVPRMLVLLGLVSLFIGVWEHRHLMIQLADVSGKKHRVSSVGVVALLVGLLGFMALAGLFVRIDF